MCEMASKYFYFADPVASDEHKKELSTLIASFFHPYQSHPCARRNLWSNSFPRVSGSPEGRPSAPREFCLSIEIDYQDISGKATWYSLGTGLQMRHISTTTFTLPFLLKAYLHNNYLHSSFPAQGISPQQLPSTFLSHSWHISTTTFTLPFLLKAYLHNTSNTSTQKQNVKAKKAITSAYGSEGSAVNTVTVVYFVTLIEILYSATSIMRLYVIQVLLQLNKRINISAGAIAHQNNLPQEECDGGDDDGDGDEGYDGDDDGDGGGGDDRDDDDGDGGDDGDDRDDDGGGDDDGDGGPVEAAGLVCGGMPQLDGVRLVLLCGGVLGGEEGTDDSRDKHSVAPRRANGLLGPTAFVAGNFTPWEAASTAGRQGNLNILQYFSYPAGD